MSTLKVDGIRSNSASSDAITLASDGTCTANITNRSNRNLIINGAMLVAQRGTSSTSDSYATVDRFKKDSGGFSEAITQEQVDVASGTTPYTLGFTKALKYTNGNQTNAGAGDYVQIGYAPEAQDIRNSGWNYLSSSSYITLSFWVKASVAQTYQIRISSKDGTSQGFVFEYALSANTWTKITKTIPGNSNLQFDNDTGPGLEITFLMFIGTTYTSASPTLDAWGAYSYLTSRKDMTSTWWTTNNATFELTGVKLELGSHSTDFEFRSFGQELALCQRYYQKYSADGNSYRYLCTGSMDNDGDSGQFYMMLHTPMRTAISSMDTTGTAGDYAMRQASTETCTAVPTLHATTTHSCYLVFVSSSVGWPTGVAIAAVFKDSSAYLGFSAEL